MTGAVREPELLPEVEASAPGLEPVTACALCRGTCFHPYESAMYALDGHVLGLHRCGDCGFVFVSPRPTTQRLRALYASERYYETDYTLGVSGSSYFARRDELLAYYGKVVAELERRQRPGRIFEVGAAGGFFLEAARRRGWAASGCEISPFAAEYARRELLLPVETGDISEIGMAHESQDVVYVDNILEHTIDPISVLGKLHALLRPEGLLVVIVPTYVNSPYFRLLRLLRRSPAASALRGSRLHSLLKLDRDRLGPPYHIDEFCPRTLATALVAAGFRVERRVASVPTPDYVERGGAMGIRLLGAAFRTADLLMRNGLLPGARVEVHARRPG